MNVLIDAFAGPVARRWAAQVAAATLVFWSLGALLVLATRGRVGQRCAAVPGSRVERLPLAGCLALPRGPLGAALLGFAAAAAVAGSGLLVAACTSRLLDLLTGTGWSAPRRRRRAPRRLLALLLRRQLRRRGAAARHWSTAPPAAQPGGSTSVRAAIERRRLDEALAGVADAAAAALLRRYPEDVRLLAPTTVGNVYAAMAERVERRHGVDLAVCWEPLLSVLPAEALAVLGRESARVSLRAQNLIWAVAGGMWALLLTPPAAAAWAVAAALLLALLLAGLRDACATHADVVEALVTAHRGGLYRLAGLTPPTSTALEPDAGRTLTAHLSGRGIPDLPLVWATADSATPPAPAGSTP